MLHALVLACHESKRRCRMAALLFAHHQVRMPKYLILASLVDPLESPWQALYSCCDHGTFVAIVSLPPPAFGSLLQPFSSHYTMRSSVGRPGRSHKLPVLALLGGALHLYTCVVERKTLREVFSVPPSVLSHVLCAAEQALDGAVAGERDARITYPSMATQLNWTAMTAAREPLVKGVGVCVCVDGKNYRVRAPTDANLQNAHHNR
ncbi:hypothetical protein PybrP1_002138 [[Pythium] brassicae (nom. inval.)]|nr:hypothetical protein PybrP1_002138 [[Pythium] brassicae (nom. inval.)]